MRGRFRLLVLALSVLVLSVAGAISVSAQTLDIAPGETVTGTLDATNPFLRYEFTLEEAAEVTITLESSEFDAYVLLENADGEVIAEDDDGAGRLNSQIVNTIDAGDYAIVATSLRAYRSEYELFASGSFELALETGEPGDMDEAAEEAEGMDETGETDEAAGDADRLFFGEAIAGELTEEMPAARYALAIENPVEATITLESDEFDAYLLLENADGEVIAEDDDSAGLLNAQIVTTLEPGSYTVVATSLRTQVTGEPTPGTFTLSATGDTPAVDDSEAGSGAPDSVIPGVPVGELEVEGSVDGELTEDTAIALYTLSLEAPLGLSITLESNEFDAYLVLYDAAGEIVAEDDDGAGGLNSQIEGDFAAGEYVVAATSLRAYRSEGDLVETGSYMLTTSILGTGAESDAGEGATGEEEADDVEEEPAEETEEPAEETEEPAGEGDEEPVAEVVVNVGDTVEGELTDEMPSFVYPFNVETSQEVTITLTSDEFDPYLLLTDENGEIIAEDDDSAGSLDSQLELTLQPGGYALIVTSFSAYFTEGEDIQTGAYTLAVAGAEQPEPEAPAELTSIAPGDTVDGSLSIERPAADYVLDAEAGSILTIEVSSNEFDTYLQIVDSAGEIIAQDDDGGGNLNSRLTAFVVPEGAPVRIRVTSYGNLFRDSPESGTFVLSVTAPQTQEIAYGETVESQLDEDNIVGVFTFTGSAGDIVNATLEAASDSLFMELTGNGLDSFSSGGVIGPVVLPADGEYALTVSSFDIVSMDTFTLTLNTVEPEAITYGEGIPGDFADGIADYYTFEGEPGDIISVNVETGQSVDTFVRIIGPNGGEIAFDDDSGPGFDPEIDGFELFDAGTYSVIVEPYIEGDDGDYTLTVASEAGRSLDTESYVIRISDKQFTGVLSFEGMAGETVTLVARPLVDNRSEPRVTVTQDGEILASNSIGQVGSLGISFEVPVDGTVIVTVEDFNGNASVIEFTLAREE